MVNQALPELGADPPARIFLALPDRSPHIVDGTLGG
jgi:hypothetical protein